MTKKQAALELAQLITLTGKPSEDSVTMPVSLFNKMLQLAFDGAFSEKWYLDSYPDVNEAVEDGVVDSGLSHYVGSGIYEGRFPFELKLDAQNYVSTHEDVGEAIQDGFFENAHDHFLNIGYSEGRRFKLKPPPTGNKNRKTTRT